MRSDRMTWVLTAALMVGPAVWSHVRPATEAVIAFQVVEAPTLSAHQQDRLRLAERDIEVAALRLTLAQVQLRDAQTALQQQVQALAHEGYRLERTEAGAWVYTPVEP